MSIQQIFTFITNSILPLEQKHSCHIFVRYSAHTGNIDVEVCPLKWASRLSVSHTFYFCEGEMFDANEKALEIEKYIVETKENETEVVKRKLEALEIEKADLLKRIQ